MIGESSAIDAGLVSQELLPGGHEAGLRGSQGIARVCQLFLRDGAGSPETLASFQVLLGSRQIGLSMKADVDTHDRSGSVLPRLAAESPSWSTDVFSAGDDVANQRVKAIISANESGRATPAAAIAPGVPVPPSTARVASAL